MKLLYYVALPYTEEILNLVTLFSIDVMKQGIYADDCTGDVGLFTYSTRLVLESINHGSEWLLDTDDALHVLALYADRDFNGVCEYLNNIPNKPFTVHVDASYLNYMI